MRGSSDPPPQAALIRADRRPTVSAGCAGLLTRRQTARRQEVRRVRGSSDPPPPQAALNRRPKADLSSALSSNRRRPSAGGRSTRASPLRGDSRSGSEDPRTQQTRRRRLRPGGQCAAGLLHSRAADPWGRSSVGRALEWHSRGRGFDSHRLHHVRAGVRGWRKRMGIEPTPGTHYDPGPSIREDRCGRLGGSAWESNPPPERTTSPDQSTCEDRCGRRGGSAWESNPPPGRTTVPDHRFREDRCGRHGGSAWESNPPPERITPRTTVLKTAGGTSPRALPAVSISSALLPGTGRGTQP